MRRERYGMNKTRESMNKPQNSMNKIQNGMNKGGLGSFRKHFKWKKGQSGNPKGKQPGSISMPRQRKQKGKVKVIANENLEKLDISIPDA